MKNLTRLFVAVAVLFTSFACTTDATEDLGVKVGGQTEIVLSLEESRTQLGEKADELYPLYWSEGDQIAVNGVASAALTAEQAGGAGAVFTFDAVLTRPLSIIYPASAEAGSVTFLANQEYKVGTFASGAAPMYGYATEPAEGEEAAPIQLHHLTGVLRFAVKGDVSLAKAVITSDSGDLAGTYAIDCANGALTPQEGLTSKQITLSFGEGLALNAAEATPFYVTVPAGKYGAMQVRLTTTDDKNMVVKFSAYGDKAIKAGTVREFGEFTFVENAVSADEAGVYEIYTYDDLLQFAKIAAVFSPRTEAKLMANINIPEGEQWTSIEGFTHTFNGNNFAIDGLTAPLFGHSEAKIYDLTLTNVNISVQDLTHCGTFANVINNGALTNCSAEGTLTFGEGSSEGNFIGGLVGYMSSSEFHHNTNRVNIVVNGTMVDVNDGILRIGGVAASLLLPTSKVEGCKNYGSITINGAIDRSLTGGVFSICGSTAEVADCHNEGEIHLPTNFKGKSHSVIAGLIAGVENDNVAGATFKVSSSSNKGCILFGDKGGEEVTPTTGESVYYIHLCGFVGYTRGLSVDMPYTVELSDCENRGNVEVNAANAASVVKLSGIMSQLSAQANISNCHNYGKLAVYNGAKHQIFFGGGICHIISEVGDSTVNISNCSNNGEIYASEKISHGNTPYYGGFTAYINNAISIYYNNVYNHGKITYKSLATGNTMVYTGGVIGYLDASTSELHMTDCGNTGELNYLHSLSEDRKNMYLGGVIGHNGAKLNEIKNITNTGNITAAGSANRFILAGLVGSAANDLPLENYSNSGNITVESTQSFAGEHAWIAGCTGVILNTTGTKSQTLTNCSNSGDILVQNTTFTGQLAIGGVSAQMIYNSSNKYFGKMYMTDCTNTGDITVQDVAVTKDFSVGGILSSIGKETYAEIKAPVQNGNITVSISSENTVVHTAIGGIIGNMESGKIIKNDSGKRGSVSGQIKVLSHAEAAGQWHSVAGIAGFVAEKAEEISDVDVLADNNSCISLEMTNAACNTYAAGIVGYVPIAITIKNIVNNAPVSYKVNTQSTSDCQPYVSGGCGRTLAAVTMDNCTNNGDITVEGTKMTVELDCGGLLACNHTAHGIFSNLTNNGDILIKKGDGTCGILYIAGIAGGQLTACTATNHFSNCTNNGDITLEEGLSTTGKTGNIRLGGCFAWTKQSYDKNIRNNGDIYIHGKTTGTNTQLLLGGVYGYNAAGTDSDMVGGYINTGDIIVTGGASASSTNAFGSAIGGIVGAFYGNISNAINTGDIKFTGSSNAANSTVGGIVGYSTAAGKIKNCQHYGNIQAIDMVKGVQYPNVGAITGSIRVQKTGGGTARTALVENCQLGGAMLGEYNTEDESYKKTVLDASNYYNFIYGSGEGTDWTGTDNYDGCSVLTAKPNVD